MLAPRREEIVDTAGVASFLRARREALQPDEVGLPRGPRRRARGLRREEVAALAGMSADYYARLERGGGPQPSEQILAAIARALRLTLPERDHLFAAAGHRAPRSDVRGSHVDPGMLRVLDRLDDTPAQVMDDLGQTLVQNDAARALLGDETAFTGADRSAAHRWFTDPRSRLLYAERDHEQHGRTVVAQLRGALTAQGRGSRADRLVTALVATSEEFCRYWGDQQVGLAFAQEKHFRHPTVGDLDLYCQVLADQGQQQSLLVFTATPGTEHAERLRLLMVLGTQHLDPRFDGVRTGAGGGP